LRPPRPPTPDPPPPDFEPDPHIDTIELETIDTLSTIPIETLRDIVGETTTPAPPFQLEKGLFEVEQNEDPLPTTKISKLTDRYHMRKLREIRINTQCQGDTGANVGATHDKRILWNYRMRGISLDRLTLIIATTYLVLSRSPHH
jgi:hypothetical protein